MVKKLIKIIILVLLIVWAVIATVFVGIKTNRVNKLEKEITIITKEYNNFQNSCNKELSETQEKIKKQDETITNLNNQIKTLKKKVNNVSAVKTTSGNKKTYQDYAYDLVINKYEWTENDFNALVNLWYKESNWTVTAGNKSSGAYGIPQALPASKMASEGSDYLTNYQTQIKWGLKYIKQRYGTPTAAWNHFLSHNWY